MAGSLLLVLIVVAAGHGATYRLPLRLRWEERVAVGAVLGIVLFCLVSFVMFELVGMGWPTVIVGAGLPTALGIDGVLRSRAQHRAELVGVLARLRLPSRRAASLRPFAVVTVLAAAVATRTLAIAYRTTSRGIAAGNLAIYGDWAAHLAYAGSFAYGDNRALRTPLAAGAPLRYHFLCDFFAAPFTVTGATLPQALTLTAWVLAVAFTPLLLFTVQRLTGSRLAAILALLVFTLSGGAGAWYFLVDVHQRGWSILTKLPRTYARIPGQNLWYDNTISMSLYAQRSTQMGLCIGLAALVLLLAARVQRRRAGFVVAGLLVAVTGISYVHLLLTALALGVLAGFRDRRAGRWRDWAWFVAPAAALGLPMVLTIRPPSSAMRWLVGWMAVDAHQSWWWFWLRNLGLFVPLFAVVMAARLGARRLRVLALPLWLWFAVPNLVSFHPWPGNNVKFFLFWQLAGAVVIADALARAWRTRGAWGRVVALALTGALTVSGALDTVRGMEEHTGYGWVEHADVAAADWLRHHARSADVLVYGATNTSAVAATSGVAAVSGYPGWSYDLGLPDWYTRQQASLTILAGGPEADALVRRYSVDWVAIGPQERAAGASDEYWETHGELAFQAGDHRVYRVRNP